MIYGFDVETHLGCAYLPGAQLLTAALAGKRAEAWGVHHPQAPPTGGPPVGLLLEEVLLDEEQTIVGHNLFFDVAFVEKALGIRVEAQLFDTMIAQYRLDENLDNALEDVALRWLGMGKIKGLDRRKLREAPLDEVLVYNKRDAVLAKRLHRPLHKALWGEGLMDVFDRDMRRLRILVDMHHRGMQVDWRRLKRLLKSTAAEIEDVSKLLVKGSGVKDINLRSGQQVACVLYGEGSKFELPLLRTTAKGGKPSTDAETLVELRAHPKTKGAAKRWLENLGKLHKLEKLHGTYLGGLPEHRGTDDRLHTSFHLGRGTAYGTTAGSASVLDNGTVTGRLSSSRPNMQNLAKSDPLVRSCVVPRAGWRFAKGDYSQVELRVAGWLSGEPAMRDAFAAGHDYHTTTLALIEGVAYEEAVQRVAKDGAWKTKRDACKRINFGTLYGAYPQRIYAVAKKDGFAISFEEIEELWNGIRERLPVYARWEKGVHRLIDRDGVLESPFGTRRRFPEHRFASTYKEKSRAYRQGVNFLIQYSAAEIMFRALEAIENDKTGEGGELVMTVHDEVVIEYRPEGRTPTRIAAWLEGRMVGDVMASLRADGLPELEHLHLEADVSAGLARWAEVK